MKAGQVIGHGGVICFPFQVVQLPFNKSLLHLFERRGEQQLYEKFEKNNKERQTQRNWIWFKQLYNTFDG